MLSLLLLLACTRPTDTAETDSGAAETGDSAPPATRILATDIGGRAWLWADLEGGELLERHPLSELDPEECTGDDQHYCLVFQAHPHVAWDGTDEVILTWSPVDRSDGSSTDKGDMQSHLAALDARTGEVRWRLDSLDFSSLPEAGCPTDPDAACVPSPELDLEHYRACTLYMTHDMQVVSEDAAGVELWLADTLNHRLLRVRLERDSRCARVVETLDGSYPDWFFYTSPNSLQYGVEGGEEQLLVSVKGTRAIDAQQGGPSRGKIVLWTRPLGAERWSQAWEHPAESTTSVSFLNSPHGAWRVLRPDGERWVVYAHTLGLAEGWMSDGRFTGGTVGVLRLTDTGYDYLFDLTLPEGKELALTRDVSPLEDGSLLVTDSGCLSEPDCERDTALWRLDPSGLRPGTHDGAWTPDGSRLDLRAARVVSGPLLSEDATVLYSAEVSP